GTQSDFVITHLLKIKRKLRMSVKEITLDMAGSMKRIARRCFPIAVQVIDRFHVQKLAIEALQESESGIAGRPLKWKIRLLKRHLTSSL
ncbi:transposase, partial [uncultured Chryseobacterium sp.]|uniref:transposase n=1 Tax=uncultured Chryseobacterium sp. TaxID=259322 RepID=UPI0025E457D0